MNQLQSLLDVDNCQCNHYSVDHMANDCPGSARYLVVRDGRLLWLCGNCNLSSDQMLACRYYGAQS